MRQIFRVIFLLGVWGIVIAQEPADLETEPAPPEIKADTVEVPAQMSEAPAGEPPPDTAVALENEEIPEAIPDSEETEPLEPLVEPPEDFDPQYIFPDDYRSFFRFLIPVDGDIFYEPAFKLVVYLGGHTPGSIGVLLDGRPTKTPVVIEGPVMTVDISQLYDGPHYLTVLFFDNDAKIYFRKEVRFFVRIPEPEREPVKSGTKQMARTQIKSEYRGGDAAHPINSYQKVGLDNGGNLTADEIVEPLGKNFDGILQGVYQVKHNRFDGTGKAVLRTRETEFRQPAHRVSGKLRYRPWLALSAGDVYPVFNELVLRDTRLRGAWAKYNAEHGGRRWASLEVAHGESQRAVDPHIIEYETFEGISADTVPGSYQQSLSAARLGFGGGKRVDVGITFLKSTEDENSLNSMVNDSLFGPTPIDNTVAGLDFRLGFWEDKIQFFADGALSMYTKNIKLGAADTANAEWDLTFNPADFEDIIILNSTTQGLGYLVDNPAHPTDIAGFASENSAYQAGVKTAIPSKKLNSETELVYSHLGYYYHSEGNRFLGSNPEDAVSLLQRFRAFDNRLALGFEGGYGRQDEGFIKQDRLSLKGDVRYAPSVQAPSIWMGLGLTSTNPDEAPNTLKINTRLLNFFSGGFYQFQLGAGKLHSWLSYSFSQSDVVVSDTAIADQSIKANIISASLQYKQTGMNLVPRFSYSFADNGVQKPTNNAISGFVYSFLKNKLQLDAYLQVGEYPESNTQNDIKIGESVKLTYRLNSNQAVKIEQRWLQYGERKNIVAGAQYDLYL